MSSVIVLCVDFFFFQVVFRRPFLFRTSLEIWHNILDLLPVRDIFRLSRTSVLMSNSVRQYWSSKLNVMRVLRPFFRSNEQTHLFLEMMHRTGAIVSGSTALQLFERTYFEGSDLDLYVNDENSGEVGHWLSESGFGRIEQDAEKEKMVIGDSYPAVEEILKVEAYTTTFSSKVVEVITTKNAPVLAVIKFHSSKLGLECDFNTYLDIDLL